MPPGCSSRTVANRFHTELRLTLATFPYCFFSFSLSLYFWSQKSTGNGSAPTESDVPVLFPVYLTPCQDLTGSSSSVHCSVSLDPPYGSLRLLFMEVKTVPALTEDIMTA